MRDHTANQNQPWYRSLADVLCSEGFLYVLFTVFSVGVLYARAALSIACGFLLGIAILRLLLRADRLTDLKRYPGFVALMAVALIYVLSVLKSSNVGQWFSMLEINLLYITIPIGFYMFRNVPGHAWRRLLLIFIGVMTLSAISLLIDYAMHFDTYNAYYQVGKTIPTPVIHVRYSYFLALSSVMAFAILLDRSGNRPGGRIERSLLIACGLMLAITVHILAVRTGVVALYGGIVGLIVLVVVREGQWRLGLQAFAALAAILLIAYFTFPSVANKIGYVRYDHEMMTKHGALSEYSDNVRITSLQHGLMLFKANPITGVGTGDIETDIAVLYEQYTPGFPETERYPPINQYLYILVAFGILGAAVIFFLLLYPLFRTPFTYALAAVYLSTFASFVGETTIELQLGKSVFIAMVCITMLYGISKTQRSVA